MDEYEGKDFSFCLAIIIVITFFPSTFIQTNPEATDRRKRKMKNYFKEECKSVLDAVAVVVVESGRKKKLWWMQWFNSHQKRAQKIDKIPSLVPIWLFLLLFFLMEWNFKLPASQIAERAISVVQSSMVKLYFHSLRFRAFLSLSTAFSSWIEYEIGWVLGDERSEGGLLGF